MKKILGILSVLVIIALVIFFPIFPASIEKLSADTILKFHRVGGVAGFMNEVSIDSSGHVYVWGKDTGFLEAQNLNRLTSYISNHTFKDVSNRTSLYNKFIKSVDDSTRSYPDILNTSLRVSDGDNTYEVQMDDYLSKILNPWLQNPKKVSDSKSSGWRLYRNTEYGFAVQYPEKKWVDDGRSRPNGIYLNPIQKTIYFNPDQVTISLAVINATCDRFANHKDPSTKLLLINDLNFEHTIKNIKTPQNKFIDNYETIDSYSYNKGNSCYVATLHTFTSFSKLDKTDITGNRLLGDTQLQIEQSKIYGEVELFETDFREILNKFTLL